MAHTAVLESNLQKERILSAPGLHLLLVCFCFSEFLTNATNKVASKPKKPGISALVRITAINVCIRPAKADDFIKVVGVWCLDVDRLIARVLLSPELALSHCRHSAIDRQYLSRNERCRVGTEPDNGFSHFLWVGNTAHGNDFLELLLHLRLRSRHEIHE